MVLNGRLTFVTSKKTLYVWKFSVVLNVTRREIQRCGITDTGSTPKNGHDGWSFPIGIYNFLKAARLMRLSATPPSIKTWYNLVLAMVGEISSGCCPTPTMFLGQLEASNQIDVSIHLWCGAALGTGAAAAISRRKVLMMRRYVMSQEPRNMM
jgi:hypothetical protein